MSESVLIIGAGGFIGTALSQRLLADGFTVHRLQRTSSVSSGVRDKVHVGDQGDSEILRSILPSCNTVFHLASSTTPGSSLNSPVSEGELNLLPMLRLLEVMQSFQHVRLVFVSSGGTVYGNSASDSVAETAPLAALSYHGAGKLASEAFLQAFQHLSGRGITVIRPSNVFGPGQPLCNGFGLIRTMREHALRGITVHIWGDGESVRDFLYIDDMIEACCKMLKNEGDAWRVFNVGAGQGHSINQIKKVIEKVIGKPIVTAHHPPRPGDVRRIVLDCSKLNAELGWHPAVTLEEGIRRTWRWIKDQPQ